MAYRHHRVIAKHSAANDTHTVPRLKSQLP